MYGKLRVVVGPMCSGKSDALIRALRRAELKKVPVIAVKPTEDTRSEGIMSRTGFTYNNVLTLRELFDDTLPFEGNLVVFDEVHLFDEPELLLATVSSTLRRGADVLAAGLDMDFRGVPFDTTCRLMALADEVTKMPAVCSKCGADAQMTQRLVNGKPAKASDPVIIVDVGTVGYEPRCRNCHEIGE